MKLILLTQYDNLYQPAAVAEVCAELASELVAIVSLPTMGTDSGGLAGLRKYIDFLGWRAFIVFGWRTFKARLMAKLYSRSHKGKFYSIEQVANSWHIPYYYFDSVKSESFNKLLDETAPELLISLSCPQILGKSIRDRFPAGCINVHGAPLPKYRGVMPSFWMLKNGEKYVASTVHDLEAKIDDGAILVQKQVEILPTDSWHDVLVKTKTAGAHALVEAVTQIKNKTVQRKENNREEATYFSFPTKTDRKEFMALKKKFF